jgi:hypothetical protein
MDTALRNSQFLDADEFLRTDQSEFGPAWRYELVRGTIVAHAAPAPEHGVILSNLAAEINTRLRGHPECRSEVGSGAVSQYEQRDQRRSDLQAVEGVQEIVEIYQDEMLAHAYRRQGANWTFEWIAGPDAAMELCSVGITVPLVALYERVTPEGE